MQPGLISAPDSFTFKSYIMFWVFLFVLLWIVCVAWIWAAIKVSKESSGSDDIDDPYDFEY
jgi:hypothetical protein